MRTHRPTEPGSDPALHSRPWPSAADGQGCPEYVILMGSDTDREIMTPAGPHPMPACDLPCRRTGRTRRRCACALVLTFVLLPGDGAAPKADAATADATTADAGRMTGVARIEVVYADAGDSRNRGQWGTVMPAACAGRVRIDPAQPTGEPRQRAQADAPPDTAVRVDFDLPVPGWCGLVVQMQDGNWGAQPGPALSAAGANALVFRARGARGGERVRIKAAIVSDQPFGDSAALPLDSGWIELSSDWHSYRIDTSGRDLSRVITPFVVIANDHHNPGGRLSVFFDDIRYEWTR